MCGHVRVGSFILYLQQDGLFLESIVFPRNSSDEKKSQSLDFRF